MPYFSLRAPADSDSESSGESDASYPELKTCPRVGQQASSKLPSIKTLPSSNNLQDDYLFAGKDYFVPKPVSVSAKSSPSKSTPLMEKSLVTSKYILPKKSSPLPQEAGCSSLLKTPKYILPKTSPLPQEAGCSSLLKTPKSVLPQSSSPLVGSGSIYVVKATKPMSPLGTGSVSVLKAQNSILPKSIPLRETASAYSLLKKNSKPVTAKFDPLLAVESSSSSNSEVSSGLGIKESMPESELDSSIEEPHEKVEPKQTVLPDWHGLLFGGVEKDCDEILTRPEVDTSFEDSKLAEDVALNFVANYDMPIFDCMMDFSNINKVSHAVKNIPKKIKSRKEQLVALLLMFDYLSCCCQEGNLLHLYEKCKDKNKRYHLESLDQSIRLILDRIHSDRLRLDQLQSVERLVTTCIGRIPRSLNMSYFSTPQVLKRKLKVFEMEEKSQKENSVFNFTDVQTSDPKKLKLSSVKSTTKKWELQDMDYNDLMRTPTKTGQSPSGLKSPLLASTPQSGWSVSIPSTSNSSSVKRDLLSTRVEKKSSKSDFSVPQKREPCKITKWLTQMKPSATSTTGVTSLISKPKEKSKEGAGTSSSINKPSKIVEYSYSSDDSSSDTPGVMWGPESSSSETSSKTNVGVTSLISKPIEKSKEVVGISPSNYKTEKFALQRDDYSSDDSLPDIPDIVITKLESSSYSSWRKKLLGNKTPEKSSSNLSSSEVRRF